MDQNSKTGGPHWAPASDRREFLNRAANGFGALALSSLIAGDSKAGSPDGDRRDEGSRLSRRSTRLRRASPILHRRRSAVIFLFMVGGTQSDGDLRSQADARSECTASCCLPALAQSRASSSSREHRCLAAPGSSESTATSGLDVSELFPHVATCADDLAVIRSCYTDSFVHAPAMYPDDVWSMSLLRTRVLGAG
jgi:hypothetical protein